MNKKKIGTGLMALLFLPAALAAQTLLSAEAFQQKMYADTNKILIDVRTPQEYAQGHITGAVNIAWDKKDFASPAPALPKTRNLYVYCLSGGRSAKAAAHLRSQGFTVYELDGGMMQWRAAEWPEESAAPATTEITIQALNQWIATAHAAGKKVLLDYYATWCGPCLQMEPYLKEIEHKMSDSVTVIRIDADKHPTLMKALHISALPVLQLYEKGRLTWQHIGYLSKKAIVRQL